MQAAGKAVLLLLLLLLLLLGKRLGSISQLSPVTYTYIHAYMHTYTCASVHALRRFQNTPPPLLLSSSPPLLLSSSPPLLLSFSPASLSPRCTLLVASATHSRMLSSSVGAAATHSSSLCLGLSTSPSSKLSTLCISSLATQNCTLA